MKVNVPLFGPLNVYCLGFCDKCLLKWCSIRYWSNPIHWNKNVVILTKFSSLAALEVVILTTSSAASDEHFIKMKTFPFQCNKKPWPLCCDWKRLGFLQLKFTDKFMTDVTDVTRAEMVVTDVTELWFYDGIFLPKIVSIFQSSEGKNIRLCMWKTSLSLSGHVTDISSVINNWIKGWSLGAGTPVIYDGILTRRGKVYSVPKYTAKTVI